jgi:hypothetical protein
MIWLLNIFRKPSALILAQRELEQAQRDLLDAQTGYEYAKRIADYNCDRIKRLTAYLREAHAEDKP